MDFESKKELLVLPAPRQHRRSKYLDGCSSRRVPYSGRFPYPSPKLFLNRRYPRCCKPIRNWVREKVGNEQSPTAVPEVQQALPRREHDLGRRQQGPPTLVATKAASEALTELRLCEPRREGSK